MSGSSDAAGITSIKDIVLGALIARPAWLTLSYEPAARVIWLRQDAAKQQLESTCARSTTESGSRYQGKFLEIEFNRAGAPVGATITNYLLGQREPD